MRFDTALPGVLGRGRTGIRRLLDPGRDTLRIDPRLSVVDVTLSANVTVSLPVATEQTYHELRVILRQNAVGGFTVAWPAQVAWAGGVSPTFPTTAGAVSGIVTLITTDGGRSWVAFASLDGELAALAGLVSQANTIAYYTGLGTAALADFIGGAWTAFTPTMSLGWALGNSAYTAVHFEAGRLTVFTLEITVGSSATKGTQMAIALPPVAAVAAGLIMATAVFQDVGSATYAAAHVAYTTTNIFLRPQLASGTYVTLETDVTSTVPFTWATGDKIRAWGLYEAAA